MVSVSCFGQSGPYAGRPGSGTIGEGFAGLTGLTGRSDDTPMLPSVALGDALGAMSAAIGTMAALYWRDMRGGAGQEIDVSLYEPVLFAISQAVAQWQPGKSPKRQGGRLSGSPIRNAYKTVDGRHVVISASTARHAKDIVEIAGGTERDDPDTVVARWIATKSRAEIIETLTARRIPIAPVNEIEELIHDRHVIKRGSLTISELDGLPLAVASPQPLLSKSPASIRTLSSKLGEHTQEILEGLS